MEGRDDATTRILSTTLKSTHILLLTFLLSYFCNRTFLICVALCLLYFILIDYTTTNKHTRQQALSWPYHTRQHKDTARTQQGHGSWPQMTTLRNGGFLLVTLLVAAVAMYTFTSTKTKKRGSWLVEWIIINWYCRYLNSPHITFSPLTSKTQV